MNGFIICTMDILKLSYNATLWVYISWFLSPMYWLNVIGASFLEDSFSRYRVGGDGFQTIQEHYFQAHLLLCCQVPNRPRPMPGVLGPEVGTPVIGNYTFVPRKKKAALNDKTKSHCGKSVWSNVPLLFFYIPASCLLLLQLEETVLWTLKLCYFLTPIRRL